MRVNKYNIEQYLLRISSILVRFEHVNVNLAASLWTRGLLSSVSFTADQISDHTNALIKLLTRW